MLTRTDHMLTVLITETGGGTEEVIGRLDFPVYRAPRRILGRDVPGTEREVLGFPASLMSQELPRAITALVDAEHERNRPRFELFSRDWVIDDLIPAIGRAGYGARGPYAVPEKNRFTYRSREPLADGLRRVGVAAGQEPVATEPHRTAIGSFIHRVAARGVVLTRVDEALHTVAGHSRGAAELS